MELTMKYTSSSTCNNYSTGVELGDDGSAIVHTATVTPTAIVVVKTN